MCLLSKRVLFSNILHLEIFLNAAFFFFICVQYLWKYKSQVQWNCFASFSLSYSPHVIVQNSSCMAPDQSLKIPILILGGATCFAHDPKPGSTELLSGGGACWGDWERDCTLCHPTCPSHLILRPQIFSRPHWYSSERSIWLFGSSTEVILVVWEFLLHLSHGLDSERVPGILMSRFWAGGTWES